MGGRCCAGSYRLNQLAAHRRESREARTLVDIGCTTTLVTSWSRNPNMSAVDGRKVRCRVIWLVEQGWVVKVQLNFIDEGVNGVDVVVGGWVEMDVIVRLGGVTVRREGSVEFGNRYAVCYEYGEEEEGCENGRTRVERGRRCMGQ